MRDGGNMRESWTVGALSLERERERERGDGENERDFEMILRFFH